MPLRIQINFHIARDGRGGGKPAAPSLLKPVKPNTKRAAFLRWHLDDFEGRSIGATMAYFGLTRPNVLAHWTAIHREHGIGYALAASTITPLLPEGSDADSIWK